MQDLKLFVTGHKGFETPLFHELRAILAGSEAVLDKRYGGVGVDGDIEDVYRLCLHSRLANRVFCELASARVESEERLYEVVHEIPWEQHFSARASLAVAATISRSKLDHAHFVALKCKDAIVDRFRELTGSRPVIDKKRPDIRVHLHLHQNRMSISLDLSGDSLQRRGYRQRNAGAPLKEHLAAALLRQAGWSREAAEGLRLVDPMCGSGTFAIEAAMIASGIAPGLGREYFGFLAWTRHDPELWQTALETARAGIDREVKLQIHAADHDARALEIARANAQIAGVDACIEFSRCDVAKLSLPHFEGETLFCCNPPWGRRLDSEQDLGKLYDALGDAVRRHAPARLAVLSANPELLHRLKLKRLARKDVKNGALDCLFAEFSTTGEAGIPARQGDTPDEMPLREEEGSLALRNRLQKNARHLQRWAARNAVSCYRIYDADLPEFAFALDRYQSDVADQEWFHLQEYQAPASIDPEIAAQRIRVAEETVRRLFALSPEQLYCKTRRRQRGREQYRKVDERGEFFQVREGQAALLINLSDYLDSGLFLDHRPLRERIFREARDKTLLNLFCYTGAVGVQAGLGGARSVVNVDLSATYLDWARENHRLNGLDDAARFRFLRADVIELLRDPGKFSLPGQYDLIFFDPPSFSNSSRMQQTLDIQRDHADMLRQAMRLLATDGLLLFSTNRRGFRLDESLAEEFCVKDISRSTIAEDFRRNSKIHRCWEFRRPTAS